MANNSMPLRTFTTWPVIRCGLLLGAVLVIAATSIALLAPEGAEAKRNCGTLNGKVAGYKAKVIAIRGVKCKRAKQVARRYARKFRAPGQWECFVARAGTGRLFSCGYGGRSGDVRKWPHALEVRKR
jgi:hypothetical protein